MTMFKFARCAATLSALVAAVPAVCFAAGAPANTNWENVGNSPEVQHHADVDQINTGTVGRLGLAWAVDMPTPDGLVGNPQIKNGVIFQSGSMDRIYANDLKSGKLLWTFDPNIDFRQLELPGLWGGRNNRGLSLFEDLAIVATADCRLIAVDIRTGQKRWEAQACDAKSFYAITGAPRIGDGIVFIGNSCLDSGLTRGHVDAFDARTGERRWRFWTVPGDPARPPENDVYKMAAKTWGTDWYSKTKGCGSAWDAMAYDPENGLLIFGVAGPAPFNPAQRAKDAGDELFTTSVVAVNARTGEYVWHFKETPQDGWNYDAAVGIMVATVPVNGAPRRVVVSVPKNGFLYVIDAKTGKFISGRNYVEVNWAKGLDAKGRPIPNPDANYWERPDGTAVVLPSSMGSHGWEALALSPADHLVYIPAEIMPMLAKSDPTAAVGGLSMGFYYGSSGDPKWKAYGELVAWDVVAQKERWRHRDPMPVNGGILHTSGNLVFQGGADGYFNAYDARKGTRLWSKPTGGAIRGAAATAMLDGVQYIVVPNGNGNTAATGSYVARYAATPRARSQPRLLAYRLDAKAPPPPWADVPPMPKPAAPRFDKTLAGRGGAIFEQNMCVDCHGLGGESARGATPDLRLIPPAGAEQLADIIVRGALKPRGMPRFDNLTDDDAKAVYAFLINQAWDAYDAEHHPRRPKDPSREKAR